MTPPPPGRAVRLHGRRDLRIHDEPAPALGPGEVLVRVMSVGLCGSDRHWYLEGSIGSTRLAQPLVLGHEVAGVIEGGARAGERVVVDPADPCGACEACRAGRGRLCPSMRFAGTSPTDGGLRTWLAWPSARCRTIPPSIPDAEAPLLEVLGIALHALDLASVRSGMTAGVYGCGPVGLILIRALRAAGIEEIIATDGLAHRVHAAEAAGASGVLVDPNQADPAARLPVDVAFECAGDDRAIDTAIHAVRPAGTVLLIGIPEGDRSSIPASAARRKELTLRFVRRMEAGHLPRAIASVASGAISLKDLVTHRFGLEDSSSAFQTLEERSGLKVIVEI